MVLEEKQFSVSVHYRKSRDKQSARRIIRRIAEGLPGAHTIGGKQVVNIVPRGAPHKGQAVEQVRRRQKLDTVLYVGDDDTDENAFAMRRTGRVWGIRVGTQTIVPGAILCSQTARDGPVAGRADWFPE